MERIGIDHWFAGHPPAAKRDTFGSRAGAGLVLLPHSPAERRLSVSRYHRAGKRTGQVSIVLTIGELQALGLAIRDEIAATDQERNAQAARAWAEIKAGWDADPWPE